MEKVQLFIRTGLGKTSIHKSKPFCVPLFHSLTSFDSQTDIDFCSSIELGLLSRDGFFLDIDCSLKLQSSLAEAAVLKALDQGTNYKTILKNTVSEAMRSFLNKHTFENISKQQKELEAELLKALESEGIASLNILHFSVERTALDDYDLGNIIHFEKAKEIVTQIARVNIKDKEFIDKCRKTISHFDIVDE